MAEDLVDAVIYVCPCCGFEMFDSVEALRKKYGFDGVNLNSLPDLECMGCQECLVKPSKHQKIPASWFDPFYPTYEDFLF